MLNLRYYKLLDYGTLTPLKGLPTDNVGARMDKIEDALFYKHGIDTWLCNDSRNNYYCNMDTEEDLTHAQVMVMIG